MTHAARPVTIVTGGSRGIGAAMVLALAGAPDRVRQAESRIPLGRAAEPDEIAPAIVWLLGSAAAYATGGVAGGV
jgi:NAD(P)-dependent dehydrogenase (short-subunit alcohol dehydrogenase family)